MARFSRLSLIAGAGTLAALCAAAACTSFSAEDPPAPAGDAGSDALPAGDAGESARFCADATDFCDDFERTDVPGKWVIRPDDKTDGLAIDTQVSASPTRSLRVTFPGGLDSGTSRALSHELTATNRRIEVSFAMRIDALPEAAVEMALAVFDSSQHFVLIRGSRTLGLRLAQHGPADQEVPIGRPDPNVFVRYTLVVDLDAQTAEITSSDPMIHGKLALMGGIMAPVRFELGNTYTPPMAAAATAWFDDVIFR